MRVKYLDVVKAMMKKSYKLFSDPFELNIVGIRSADMTPNTFNDMLIVFYKGEDLTEPPKIFQYEITTDPGLYWLEKPLNVEGTAILYPGQYDVYSIDKHRGKYEALCQRRGPVKVYRDDNRNSRFDAKKTEEGMLGINIHKSGTESVAVNKWSAGCQVFRKEDDFNQFMEMAQTHRAIHGNKFTYTLLTEIDLIDV